MNRSVLTLLPVILLFLLLQGCTSTLDSQAAQANARTPDVYHEGKPPSRRYHEIALLKDNGRRDEQVTIEAKMVKEARGMAADGIVFLPLIRSGTDAGSDLFTSTAKPTYLYRGSVIRYE